MQNIVIDICEKFHYDRLRNNRALVHWKSYNNNPKNNNNNNVGSAWGPVSGSKNRSQLAYNKSYKKVQQSWQTSVLAMHLSLARLVFTPSYFAFFQVPALLILYSICVALQIFS